MIVRNRIAAGVLVIGLAVSLTACVAADPEGDAARGAELSVRDTDELGDILADGEGNVLYIFVPDDASRVTCTFTCASNWPPLTALDGELPAAAEGINADLIGTLANPAGGEVVTYNDWPLYRYAADKTPGEHRGHDRHLNGGVWLVMQPDGEPLDQ